ncbi:MAG: hypothetical protein O3C27_17685 [Actinomycetota bacterium]|nr:hypothetical protein [Actinomycetota bacterium]
MGLFANLRKNKSEHAGSDDWLLDPQEDVDPAELALLGLPVSPPPEHEALDVGAASPAPPASPDGLGAWHLPEVENDRRISEPKAAFDLSSEISQPGPVAFAEPEPPPHEPLDFAQYLAAAPQGAAFQWEDAPPPADWDVAGYDEQGSEEPLMDQTFWQEPTCEPTIPEPSPPAFTGWAPGDEGDFRLNIAEAWEPYMAGGFSEPGPVQPSEPQPTAGSNVDGPTAPEATALLEILGLFPGATWEDIRAAHRELIDGHRAEPSTDEAQAHLAEQIRREMNSAYAALRLLAVSH